MTRGWRPLLLAPGAPLVFPDPRGAGRHGLVAVGGDLSVARLLLAYRCGIFPWYDPGEPPCWWSPEPRCVLPAEALHVSRSLRRRLRRGGFELTWNQAFDEVMWNCGERTEGSWIGEEMLAAYGELHRRGHAHSLEVRVDGELAGGIYGVQVGGLFAAESMFHRRTDMSKVALVACVRSLRAAGVELFDVQFQTTHLRVLGAVEWRRDRYLGRLAEVVGKEVDLRGMVPVLQ